MHSISALALLLTLQQPLPSDSAVRALLESRVKTFPDTGRHGEGIVVGLLDPSGARRIIAVGVDQAAVFEIGSITKTFTASILADMVDHGEVRLDDPVAKYLPPSVRVPSRNGKQITLLDLATQSSGLPRMPSNFTPKDSLNPYADYTVQQMYAFLSSYALTRDVGAEYEYSNLGVGLLGHALALKAGTSYEALVRQRILGPLGMHETAITLTPALRARLAPGHEIDGRVVPNWDLPTFAGAGALRSTVRDMSPISQRISIHWRGRSPAPCVTRTRHGAMPETRGCGSASPGTCSRGPSAASCGTTAGPAATGRSPASIQLGGSAWWFCPI